jgi:hypothetical protein
VRHCRKAVVRAASGGESADQDGGDAREADHCPERESDI